MNSIVKLEYAHCTRWTQDQLDCAPHSYYEMRSVSATLTRHQESLDESIEYTVTFDGVIIGEGYSEKDAIAQASHWLMSQSRKQALDSELVKTKIAMIELEKSVCPNCHNEIALIKRTSRPIPPAHLSRV